MTWRHVENIKNNIKRYSNKDTAFRAPLGGIGTGNISLDACGRFCDFEIMNHPDKNLKWPYTFFSLHTQEYGESPKAYILEAKPECASERELGYPSGELMSLPRFDYCEEETLYPFFKYRFIKTDYPFDVSMEAFTPFIPLDDKNSGLPGFSITYKVKNMSGKKANVSVSGSMFNCIGIRNYNGYDTIFQDGEPKNDVFIESGLKGIVFLNESLKENDLTAGSMILASSNSAVSLKPCWYQGGFWEGAEEFWEDFKEDGILDDPKVDDFVASELKALENPYYAGSVAASEILLPGEEKVFTFYFTWSFPNRYGWRPDGHFPQTDYLRDNIIKNFYSTIWSTAREEIIYFHQNIEYLRGYSEKFANALYSTSVPADVIETLVTSLVTLRSTTCFRTADGTFWGWEGCFNHAGSCPGTCTHVWSYAQTVAFLFPELEKSVRRVEFLEETDNEGNMAFRAKTRLTGERFDMLPAADGQMGSVLRAFREWRLTGDDLFIKEIWESIKKCMNYAIQNWDLDGDYILESQQHNTYDIEFYGISSLTNTCFYAALKACSIIADHLGETELADFYHRLSVSGAQNMDEVLWNGEFYQQKLPNDGRKYKFQYEEGCLANQILGQQFASIYGLGYILPEEHIKECTKSIFKYNFMQNMETRESAQRTFAYQDEPGLILCSWPYDNRPKHPFVYCDETWSGIEYTVATGLIFEGYIEEAFEIIRAVRSRHDGKRRNPYNEVECGNHYARSMAAWGILVAISGYDFDLVESKINFLPKYKEDDFTCFYSNGKSWGIYKQIIDAAGHKNFEIIPLFGDLNGIRVNEI